MIEPLTRPDVLVLAGGGTLGEAWMRGLLAGAEAASDVDFRACEHFVGTSAGSIVAATLAAGRRPDAGRDAERAYASAAGDAPPRRERRLAGAARRLVAAVSPVAPLALAAAAPGGAMIRAAALARGPAARRSLRGMGPQLDRLGARFDGRLRISAVDRATGRRVMFGAPRAPEASVRDAVLASCSIPWVFAPITIGGREYVDGGALSPSNLDAAPAGHGAHVLCLNPTAAIRAVRLVSRAAVAAESLVLRRRGARIRVIGPDAACAAAMGANLMNGARVDAVLDAAYTQGRALAGA